MNRFSRKTKRLLNFLTDEFTNKELRTVFLPMSNFSLAWDISIFVFVLYTSVVLPYSLCFMSADDSLPEGMVVIDVLSDLFFVIDVAVNMNTAYGTPRPSVFTICKTPLISHAQSLRLWSCVRCSERWGDAHHR